MRPSVATIQAGLGVDKAKAKAIRSALEVPSPFTNRTDVADASLEKVSALMGWFGVEAIFDGCASWPSILYANNGDSYQPTIVYDATVRRYYVEGWADAVERHERKGILYA